MSTTKTEARMARPPKALVPLIQQDLKSAYEAGIEHYRAAGEKLREAKSQLERGQWGKWLGNNFVLSQRTAQRYMALAGELEFIHPYREVGHRPLRQRPVQQSLVTNRLNVQRLKEERQNREREDKLRHALELQLINLGYKALATKLHPNKGGSPEAMARLNRIRAAMRAQKE